MINDITFPMDYKKSNDFMLYFKSVIFNMIISMCYCFFEGYRFLVATTATITGSNLLEQIVEKPPI